MSKLKTAQSELQKAFHELKTFKEGLDAQEGAISAEDLQKLENLANGVTTTQSQVESLTKVELLSQEHMGEYTEEVSSNVSQKLDLGVSGTKKIDSLGTDKYKRFIEFLQGPTGSTYEGNYLYAKRVYQLQEQGATAEEAAAEIAQIVKLGLESGALATTISTNIPALLPTRFDASLYRPMMDRDGFYRRADVRTEGVMPGNTVTLPKLNSYGTTPNAAVGEVAAAAEIDPTYGRTDVTVTRRAVFKDLSDTVVKGATIDMVNATMTNLMWSLMDHIEGGITTTVNAVTGSKIEIESDSGVRVIALVDFAKMMSALDTGYFRDKSNMPIWMTNLPFYISRYALNTALNRVLNINAITNLAGDLNIFGFRNVLSAHYSNVANAATNTLAFFGLPFAAIVVGETGDFEFKQDVQDTKTDVLTVSLRTYMGWAIQDANAYRTMIGH